MADIDLTLDEIAEMFGGEAGDITPDAEELEVTLALQSIRSQLIELAERQKVNGSRLARRLHISPAAVSRTLGGESDMKVSTAVLYARALGHRWDITLVPDGACQHTGNHSGRPEMTLGISNTSTATAGPVLGVEAMLSPYQGGRAEPLLVQTYSR